MISDPGAGLKIEGLYVLYDRYGCSHKSEYFFRSLVSCVRVWQRLCIAGRWCRFVAVRKSWRILYESAMPAILNI